MRDDCVFLETGPGGDGRPLPPRCTAGINFYWVGDDREFCRICPLATREPTPVCDYAFVFTFLRVIKGQREIQVEVDCDVTLRDEDGVGPCLHCPVYVDEGPVPWPSDVPLPVGRHVFELESSPSPA